LAIIRMFIAPIAALKPNSAGEPFPAPLRRMSEMSMTKKDFEKFADAFRVKYRYTIEGGVRREMLLDNVRDFMDVCISINPRFDRERFMARVKGDEEE